MPIVVTTPATAADSRRFAAVAAHPLPQILASSLDTAEAMVAAVHADEAEIAGLTEAAETALRSLLTVAYGEVLAVEIRIAMRTTVSSWRTAAAIIADTYRADAARMDAAA